MDAVGAAIDRRAAETDFSGVVRVDQNGATLFAEAYGMSHRALGVANTIDTQFAIASGVKTLNALTMLRLIERDVVSLDTPARSLLHDDLPLINDDVTIEHLLAHRSGIGDYLDEDEDHDIAEYLMTRPVHELTTTASYLPMLEGHPRKFAAGTDFSYCNGGYVVLALLAERATGRPFHDLVTEHVCEPAGLDHTAFLRSDELPGGAALGYLTTDGPRTNVFHLPVVGGGDGGIYTTVTDVHVLWAALLAGRIVSDTLVAEMMRPRSTLPSGSYQYGLGLWIVPGTNAVQMEGADAGVSFRSTHDPTTDLTWTVISNTSDGAWPIARHLGQLSP